MKIFQKFSNFCLEGDEFRKNLELEPENDESLDAELWVFDEGFRYHEFGFLVSFDFFVTFARTRPFSMKVTFSRILLTS